MIRICKNTMIVLFVLFFSMRWGVNDYLGNDFTTFLENGIRVLAAIFCGCLYLKNRRKDARVSPVFFLLIMMCVWLLLSTVLNNGALKDCIVTMCGIIVYCLLFESMRDHPDAIINGSMLFAETLIYGNLLTVLLFPDGMYSSYRPDTLWYTDRNWLLGNKNVFLPYILFAFVIAYIYRIRGGHRYREWGIYVASALSIAITRSAASTVAVFLLIILFFGLRSRHVKYNTYPLLGVNITLFFLIVIFRAQNLFSFLIVDVLGKSLTLSGRTPLWDAIWPLISEKPIFGYGIMEAIVSEKLTGISYGMHAHNLIIDCIYKGGIIYLGLYLVTMVFVYRKLHKFQNTAVAQGVIAVLFVYQIAVLVEVFPGFNSVFIYLIYLMAYYIDRFIPYDERDILSERISEMEVRSLILPRSA